jgi:DNA-binding response OmpR family regulator
MTDPERAPIVEDDPKIAQVVAVNLRDLGLETERAVDGRTGLHKALDGGYSLVVLDLMLPGLDGLTACRSIRGKNPLPPIPMSLFLLLVLALGAGAIAIGFSSAGDLAQIKQEVWR